MRSYLLSILSLLVLSIALPTDLPITGDEVTAAQMKAVHAAYQKAKAEGFSIESMVAIYKLDNAASAVKKLVDSAQSNPAVSISQADSAAMEGTRQKMNQMVLDHLARVTGGTVEVINFGKQNGIRSDKDQTIYATDGKRVYDATEMKVAYEGYFQKTFGLDMERMDMSMFDGDAYIPDWRDTSVSFQEFITRYEKGQAKLGENPEAYQEAGTFRAQVDGRTANQGRVTVTKHNPETGETEVIQGKASEISSRYAEWTQDVPYRNAMDSSVENKGRFDHSADFIDKMKYFNRTVGNGLNALSLENWDVDYIFHLNSLESAGERRAFIKQMVDDTMTVGASAGERETFAKVIEIAAQIEIDKMNSSTQGEEHYLKPLIDVERKNARSRGEDVDDAELLKRARSGFYDLQTQVMDRNIVATASQKIQRDFDPKHLKKIARKYGEEQAKKLRWETARQIQRAFQQIDDPKLADRLVAEAPEHLRAEIEGLRKVAKVRKAEARQRKNAIELEKSDKAKAKVDGPEEKILSKKKGSFLEDRKRETDELIAKLKDQYEDFDSNLRSGQYSDEAVTLMLRDRMLDSLGFEERVAFEDMEVQYRLQFSGSKLLSNVVNLGNVNSLISCIQVYQQTGDLTKVAQTALWEVVSNFPGVSQFATLKQSWNNGDYQSLSWLFIAWKLPVAGQVKMVFDVAANTMRIVYDHAMTPLANDRFSQVYMGYVDKQAAGWSPLVPGWKERREAAGLSILQFVPGGTFAEKRTNMYRFFQAKLNEKLVRNGLDPTTSEYWERRDQIVDAYFGSYVTRFFNAQDEFYDNTTVDLRAIAKIPELKKRLIATLKRDFEQGEMNDRLAEVARDEMNEAIAKIARQQQESLEIERTLLGTESFVTAKLKSRMEAAFTDLADLEEEEAPTPEDAIVKIEIYPRTVLEGQEARISVKALSEGAGQAHQIEVKKLKPIAIIQGADNAKEKLIEAVGKSDAPFVERLIKSIDDKSEAYVSRISYEVTVKDAAGNLLEKKEVSVNLAAASGAEPPPDEPEGIIIRHQYPKPGGHPLARDYITKWQEPSMENCTQAKIGYLNWRNNDSKMPFVWVRWPDMPKHKCYGMRIVAEGAVPWYTHEKYLRITPRHSFRDRNRGAKLGNGFVGEITLARERMCGKIKVSGELLAFDDWVRTTKMAATKPAASYPFEFEFEILDEPFEGTGEAHVGYKGWVEGSFKTRWRQYGNRICRVSGGGSTYYGVFSGRMSFTLPTTQSPPSSVTVSFKDYGKEKTFTVPITAKPPKKRHEKDTEGIARTLERINEAKKRGKGIDLNIYEIANGYSNCAAAYEWAGSSATDLEQWAAYMTKSIEALRVHIARGQDPKWKGWGPSRIRDQGRSPLYPRPGEAAKTHANCLKILHRRVFSELQKMGEVYLNHWQLDAARTYFEVAAAEIANLGSDPKWAAEPWRQLSFRYDKLARRTFNMTGSLDAANALYEQKMGHRRKYMQMTGKKITMNPSPFKLNEEFENSDKPKK